MTTIVDMVSNVQNGGTVTLTKDTTEEVVVSNGRTFTLDLGGFTLTAPSGSQGALVVKNGHVTVRNGTVKAVDSPCVRAGYMNSVDTAEVVLEDTVTLDDTDHSCVFLGKGGDVTTSADMTGHAVNSTEACYCITSNGTTPYFGNRCTVKGGSLTSVGKDSVRSTAIYWPHDGSLVIEGGTITGDTGVEIRAGSLIVKGGTIIAEGADYGVSANGGGPTTGGAAVAIAQHITRLPVSVTITGGRFEGVCAFSERNPQGNPVSATDLVTASIVSGTFVGRQYNVYSDDLSGFVRGGKFSGSIDTKYLSAGSKPSVDEDGSVVYWSPVDGGECSRLSDLKVDGTISSLVQGAMIGAVNELVTVGAKKDTVVYLTSDSRYYRFDGNAWVVDVPDIADKTLDGTSERPVANKAVEDMRADLQAKLDDRYTKEASDLLLSRKQDVITGAASSIVDNDLDGAIGRVLIVDEGGKVGTSSIDDAKLKYLANVDTDIRTELDGISESLDGKVSKTVYDSKMSSIDTQMGQRYTKTETDSKLSAKQNVLSPADGTIVIKNDTIKAVIPETTVDSDFNAGSSAPLRNSVITAKFKTVDTQIADRYTKSEVDSSIKTINDKLAGYEPAGDYATVAYVTNQLSGYATKDDLTEKVASVYQFKGTCTSAELDSKDKVVGNIWNLSDSRTASDGKTYKAGTSWVYEVVDASNQGWEPMGANFDIDLTSLQPKNLVFTGTVQSWSDDTTYTSYPKRGDITNAGVLAKDTATVVFEPSLASSGKFAPVCETADGHVYIWAKEQTDVSVQVVVQKG